MKVSVVGIQIQPTLDKKRNLDMSISLIDEALVSYPKIDIICLPEIFYYSPADEEANDVGPIPSDYIDSFSRMAIKGQTYIIAGSIIHRRNNKLYNTALLFDRKGRQVGHYDKIHLFDALGVKESEIVEGGESIFYYDTDFGRVGIIICYDIRFPELARTLALNKVEYLFVPAAFYSPRIDHWTDLIRATALQNLFYVIGINLIGSLRPDEVFCGRSIIADPWGITLATASDYPCFIHSYLDPEYLYDIRERVGGFSNRVPGIYSCK